MTAKTETKTVAAKPDVVVDDVVEAPAPAKRGPKPQSPATNLRASADVLPMLMQIKHRMEADAGRPIGMRQVIDFAIANAHKSFCGE